MCEVTVDQSEQCLGEADSWGWLLVTQSSLGSGVLRCMQAVFTGRPRLACRHPGIINSEYEVLALSQVGRVRSGKGNRYLQAWSESLIIVCVCMHCVCVCGMHSMCVCVYGYTMYVCVCVY